MVEAIAMAHGWEMQHDVNVVVIGQDVGVNGGVFRATAGLQERFGKDRVQDTPPARAYGLLLAAIRDPDPVMFLEPVRLYRAMRQEVNDDGRALPLDACFILREGSDVTIVTWGAMTMEALRTGAELDKRGISAEVIDLATLSPIDIETILASVAKTGRLVIVHEAARNVGVGAEIAALVADNSLYDLHAPIQRVAGFDTIMPLFKLEHDYIPSVQRIIDAVELTLSG